MANTLIVYYSRKGENYWNGGLKTIAKGNTEKVAEFIQNAVGGDLFEVDTVKPYSELYDLYRGGKAGASCKGSSRDQGLSRKLRGLRHDLCGLSQLVGHDADVYVHTA